MLIAVAVKSTAFWDIKPCNPLNVNQRFGGTLRTSLRSKDKPSKKPAWKQMANRLSLRWREYVPPKRRATLNGLDDVSHKILLFKTLNYKSFEERVALKHLQCLIWLPHFCNVCLPPLFVPGTLLGLFWDPEHGVGKFHRNVGWL
jgi:hypothetical protein